MDAEILAATLQQTCPTCKAQPGEPCHTIRKKLPHTTRQDKAMRLIRKQETARLHAEDLEYDRQIRAQQAEPPAEPTVCIMLIDDETSAVMILPANSGITPDDLQEWYQLFLADQQ